MALSGVTLPEMGHGFQGTKDRVYTNLGSSVRMCQKTELQLTEARGGVGWVGAG